MMLIMIMVIFSFRVNKNEIMS